MTEVEICGGGHHTRLRQLSTCVSKGVPPSPVYKGARGGGRRPHRVRPKGGILLLLGVVSPFPSPTKRGRKEEEGRRKEGAGPPSPKPIRFGPRRGAPKSSLAALYFH